MSELYEFETVSIKVIASSESSKFKNVAKKFFCVYAAVCLSRYVAAIEIFDVSERGIVYIKPKSQISPFVFIVSRFSVEKLAELSGNKTNDFVYDSPKRNRA